MSNSVAPNHEAGPGGQTALSLYAADGWRKYLNAAERRRALKAMATLEPDKALFVELLAWTGARVSEMLALTPASFQTESGIVAFRTLKRRRHCVREVPIPQSLMTAIAARFELGKAQLDPSAALLPLWRWHRVTAWRFVKQVTREAGAQGCAASPRGFRHGFGVAALQAGAPLNLVQRWLGHSRLSTTAIYADVSGNEERAFAHLLWALK